MNRKKFFTFKPFVDMLFCCLLMLIAILFLLKTEEELKTVKIDDSAESVEIVEEDVSEAYLVLKTACKAITVKTINQIN